MKIDLTKTNGTSPPAANSFFQPQPPPTQSRPDDQIWTVLEVAAYLKLSPRQVFELTRRRSRERSECPLPCFKIHSKCLRFRKSDVEKWLETLARNARVQ